MEQKILEILVEMQADLRNLKEDVTGLKEDVTGLKADVAELKADVAELKVGLKELSDREERHYNMLQQSMGDVIEYVRALDRRKLDKEALREII